MSGTENVKNMKLFIALTTRMSLVKEKEVGRS